MLFSFAACETKMRNCAILGLKDWFGGKERPEEWTCSNRETSDFVYEFLEWEKGSIKDILYLSIAYLADMFAMGPQ